jgi:hypothetical protein
MNHRLAYAQNKNKKVNWICAIIISMFLKNAITIQVTLPVPLQFCAYLNNAILYARSRLWPTCRCIRGVVYLYRQDCPSHSISLTSLTCGTHTSGLLQPPAPPLPSILSLSSVWRAPPSVCSRPPGTSLHQGARPRLSPRPTELACGWGSPRPAVLACGWGRSRLVEPETGGARLRLAEPAAGRARGRSFAGGIRRRGMELARGWPATGADRSSPADRLLPSQSLSPG